MSVKSAAAVTVEFTTAHPTTGAPTNADALPTGILYVDGVANAATVTVTNITGGVYKAAVTLPALTAGQMVGIRISCAVATMAGTAVVWQDTADTLYVSDVNASVVAGVPQASIAIASTLTTGTLIAGTYADTFLDNSIYLTTAPVGTPVGGFTLNRELDFNIGTAVPSTVTINGRFTAGSSRTVLVHIWNYTGTPGWDALSGLSMVNSTTDANFSAVILPAHVENGAVKLRFTAVSTTTGDRLYLDQVLVNAVAASASAAQIAEATYLRLADTVYQGGVWVDTTGGGYAGTTIGTHGLATHPCSTIADALVIAAALHVKRIYLRPGTEFTLPVATDFTGWRFIGEGIIHLGGATVHNGLFENVYEVDGVGVGDDVIFNNCGLGDGLTVDHCYAKSCMVKGNVTLTAAGAELLYFFHSCYDASSGAAACKFTFAAAGVELYLRDFRGGVELACSGQPLHAWVDGAGRVVLPTSPVAGSEVVVRGQFTLTNEAAYKAAAGTLTDSARWNEDQRMANVTLVDGVTLTDRTTDLTNAGTVDLTPVLTAIAALPDDTDVADVLAAIALVKAKTDTLGAAIVTVSAPVAADLDVSVRIGADYHAAHGLALTWSVADAGHALGLDDPAVTASFIGEQVTWPVTNVTSTTPGYDVTLELDAADTIGLTAGEEDYSLDAVLTDGDVVPLATGRLALTAVAS